MASPGPKNRKRADATSDDLGGFVPASEYTPPRDRKEDASPPAPGRTRDPGTAKAKRKSPVKAVGDKRKKGGTRKASEEGSAAAPLHDTGPPETPPAPETVPFPDTLDRRVRHAIESEGIKSLYPPQKEALEATLEGHNLLVAIPTASGKSLIAHATVLHTLLTRGGKALYIVPLRALASEKHEELRALTAAIGEPSLRVGIATGDLDEADPHLARYDIVVTTSEKADSLMRHRAGWLQSLNCVVADEVHLLGDRMRGPTLEVILARLKALNPEAQIVALSATVGNARAIADWLGARLVTSTWRPVQLKEGVFHGGTILFSDNTVRSVPAGGDTVERLALQTLAEGGQALVFVNTRRSTEAVALRLAKAIRPLLGEADTKVLAEAATRIRSEDGETTMLGAKLADAIERGAAFHNAGLSSKQRSTVEALFRARHIKTIVATPTLAAGVNLPARRVIVRDTNRFEANMGNVPLPVLEVKQMTGRAGRPRYDPWGEAVLLATSAERRDQLVATYLLGEPEDITSRLGVPAALRIHLLAGIAIGLTTSEEEIASFIDSTFLARDPSHGGRWVIQEQVDDVLTFLLDEGFIEEDGTRYRATLFGKRTSDLYIDPESALILREGLHNAGDRTEAEALAVYALVAATPDVQPLWLRKADDWIEAKAAELEGMFLRPPPAAARDHEFFLAELKTALLLQDWTDETPLDRMEVKYGLGPGDIHNRVHIAEWLLYALEEFARMEQKPIAGQVKRLKRRVHHGVREDLLAIIDLQGVGRKRARALAAAGYGSLARLKKAPVERLVRIPGFGPRIVQRLLRQLDREADLGTLKKAERAAEAEAEDGKETPSEEPAEPRSGATQTRLSHYPEARDDDT
ncbi:MAG: DEAD/DEAH box helicase [Euryarchaeota archaeon]|nr:DEAD/DEAH box helicase [Euryarchaeota archaeon]